MVMQNSIQNVSLVCRDRRTQKGLTQSQVAEKAGIAAITYKKIETGKTESPDHQTLSKIASALGFSVALFYQTLSTLEGARFRSAKRVNGKELLLFSLKRRIETYRALEQKIEDVGPKLNLDFHDYQPKAAAKELRRQFLGEQNEMDAIHNICGLLETNGVRILTLSRSSQSQSDDEFEIESEDLHEGFFGLSVWHEEVSFVVVNCFERISNERRIFTAAHELGHLVLHRSSFNSENTEETEKEEDEANEFASHFLMPEEAFSKQWNQFSGLAFVDRVLKVKRIFGVSYKTVIRRLGDKNLYPRFYSQYQRSYGRKCTKFFEPDPLPASAFKQDVLPKLVSDELLKEEPELTLSAAAQLLDISLDEMYNLRSLWIEDSEGSK